MKGRERERESSNFSNQTTPRAHLFALTDLLKVKRLLYQSEQRQKQKQNLRPIESSRANLPTKMSGIGEGIQKEREKVWMDIQNLLKYRLVVKYILCA